MKRDQTHISYRPLRTPGATAIAGVVFSVLQIISYALMHSSIPDEELFNQGLLDEYATRGTLLSLGLLPFAGIAFLLFWM